jgi:hypothetical protein
MKKTIRTAALIVATAGFALPSAFAGMGGGNPCPIRSVTSLFVSSLSTVVLSLLNM